MMVHRYDEMAKDDVRVMRHVRYSIHSTMKRSIGREQDNMDGNALI